MYDALIGQYHPQKENQWHIPFDSEITQLVLWIFLMDMIKMSVAKTAQLSYTTVKVPKDLTLEQAARNL